MTIKAQCNRLKNIFNLNLLDHPVYLTIKAGFSIVNGYYLTIIKYIEFFGVRNIEIILEKSSSNNVLNIIKWIRISCEKLYNHPVYNLYYRYTLIILILGDS